MERMGKKIKIQTAFLALGGKWRAPRIHEHRNKCERGENSDRQHSFPMWRVHYVERGQENSHAASHRGQVCQPPSERRASPLDLCTRGPRDQAGAKLVLSGSPVAILMPLGYSTMAVISSGRSSKSASSWPVRTSFPSRNPKVKDSHPCSCLFTRTYVVWTRPRRNMIEPTRSLECSVYGRTNK